MDPIHPIAPGPPPLGDAARLPVERVERVSRERDRPAPEERRRRRREPPPAPPRLPGEDDGEQPHVDVRV